MNIKGKLTLIRLKFEDTRLGWKVKKFIFWIGRWWHYWFGKEPYKIQCGDLFTIHTNDFDDYEVRQEYKRVAHQLIAMLCLKNKYTVCSEVKFISKSKEDDLLTNLHAVGWKANFLVHTKKSWRLRRVECVRKE